MSYQRKLPRDLFNEASFLKCVGRLWIALEQKFGTEAADSMLFLKHKNMSFGVTQDLSSGDLYAENIRFHLGGHQYKLTRSLNSREPWPLLVESELLDEPLEVFDKDGNLTPDLLHLIEARTGVSQTNS